jgi:hypothetical protein
VIAWFVTTKLKANGELLPKSQHTQFQWHLMIPIWFHQFKLRRLILPVHIMLLNVNFRMNQIKIRLILQHLIWHKLIPALLFPNEPVNKQSISLALVNNDVRAQYLANRMLKSSREDLQVQVQINYSGIQLESGDIVTITNSNYGWVAKEFRVMKVTENFAGDGSITANLVLIEFNAAIYDDVSITQFQPAPNTGIADPLVFGNVPAPVVGASYPTNANPLFLVNITASVQGIIQYAEVWYSAFAVPTASQLIFAGTTEIQSNGTPYDPGSALPPVSLAGIPAGTWYFFSRMVNSLGTSPYSPASAPFAWKPTTFQYSERYVSVAYADNATGTSNFNLSPTNRFIMVC